MNLAWWPHTTDSRVASFRLRCEQIVAALSAQGWPARLYSPGSAAPDCLVLSKRYDSASLKHALSLRQAHGTRLVLDLCDNHFYFQSDPQGRLARRANELSIACAEVDRVVTCSSTLAEFVVEAAPGAQTWVVPDAAEPAHDPSLLERIQAPIAQWHALQLRRALDCSEVPLSRRLIWFGNHGSLGVEGGMSDLGGIIDQLTQALAQSPLQLTVMSNNEDTYRRLTSSWTVPSRYIPWHACTFSEVLRLHSAAIIPVRHNPFTACKTANRVLSATLHGLNVIADAIPSYQLFEHCSVLNDWQHGLGPYLSDSRQRRIDLDVAQQIVRSQFSLAYVVAQWRRALER